jgi:hypothetical protein
MKTIHRFLCLVLILMANGTKAEEAKTDFGLYYIAGEAPPACPTPGSAAEFRSIGKEPVFKADRTWIEFQEQITKNIDTSTKGVAVGMDNICFYIPDAATAGKKTIYVLFCNGKLYRAYGNCAWDPKTGKVQFGEDLGYGAVDFKSSVVPLVRKFKPELLAGFDQVERLQKAKD